MKVRPRAFSLVEVVVALGVVAVGIVAIIGLLPTGLQSSSSAQDETRAVHIAQTVLTSMASQAQTQFSSIQLQANDGSPIAPIDLTTSGTTTVYSDNDGKLSANATNAVSAITIQTNSSPTGFDTGYANEVTLRVMWPAVPNQGPTPATSQTYRDYVRIISKY